ncbi:hypothetical protein GDO78_012048 [Eleutherodactylus coqui]|uniref:Uncharacterized protein n=1 Tax=Eleutherodactylus coqui TaxID=57060 RepID=A0A8J6F4U3_ELECQ|nr:hypothetical protein GDO78_012048 [Eleutherodactylus coqui]
MTSRRKTSKSQLRKLEEFFSAKKIPSRMALDDTQELRTAGGDNRGSCSLQSQPDSKPRTASKRGESTKGKWASLPPQPQRGTGRRRRRGGGEGSADSSRPSVSYFNFAQQLHS